MFITSAAAAKNGCGACLPQANYQQVYGNLLSRNILLCALSMLFCLDLL